MKLRNKIIKLAYDNPDLRPDLLPLVRQADDTALGNLIDKLKVWGTQLISGIHLSGPTEAAAKQIVNKAKAGSYNPKDEISRLGPLVGRVGDSLGIPNLDKLVKAKALKSGSLKQGMAELAKLNDVKTVKDLLAWLGGKPLTVKTADILSLIYQSLQHQLDPARLGALMAASAVVVVAMLYTAHLNTRWLLTKAGFKMIGTSFLYAPVYLLMLLTAPLSWVLGFLYDTFWPWREKYSSGATKKLNHG